MEALQGDGSLLSSPYLISLKIEGSEQVIHCFGAANFGGGAVGVEEAFGRSQLAIVVEAHRVAVCACVVDDDEIAVFQFRQMAVYRKFVVVFAE